MMNTEKDGATGWCYSTARPLGTISNYRAKAMTPCHVRGRGSVAAHGETLKRGRYGGGTG